MNIGSNFMKNTFTSHKSNKGIRMYRVIATALILFGFQAAPSAEEVERAQPTWWFGASAAANLNYYSGTLQQLNPSLTTPVPFHKGFGAGLYLAPHLEYRHDSIWGVMVESGYDGRGGRFDDVICPCGEVATLSTTLSYFTLEPSLRVAPFAGRFYMFAGPRIGFKWSPNIPKTSRDREKSFEYTQEYQSDVNGEFTDMRGVVFSGQLGMGYDIPLAAPNNKIQVDLSPFISYQPYWGQQPRSIESWAVSTLRMGATLKFGTGKVIPREETEVTESGVQFSVRAPKAVVVKRRVRETFPLRNYVFFDEGSNDISNRYVMLSKAEADSFEEEQLQEVTPKNNTGRSLRQMTVYYNILNTVGDRMKRNPATSISLSGTSENGAEHGKARAETVKKYLVDVFGIEASRINTQGRDKPLIPSGMPGGTKDLELLQAGNNRVEIESNSSEMMVQVGGESHYGLKPVQIIADVEDPLDSHVLFKVTDDNDILTSWSLEITDEAGAIQHFGPYTRSRESISGNTILGNRNEGDYKVVMVARDQNGKVVKKERSVRLVRRVDAVKEAIRFSVLFDFGKSQSKDSYATFLTESVIPLISDNSIVVIHGYTDIIGEEEFNRNLSEERVRDTRGIIENGLAKTGKQGITFETFGFGENTAYAPFDNNFPEERFYNRSVIIDIIPN